MDAKRPKRAWEDWDEEDVDSELAPCTEPVAETRYASPEDAAIDLVDSMRSLRRFFDSVSDLLTTSEQAALRKFLKRKP